MFTLMMLLGLIAAPGEGLATPPVPRKSLPEVGAAAETPTTTTGQKTSDAIPELPAPASPRVEPTANVPTVKPAPPETEPAPAPILEVEILFLYGSEKKDWIEAATRRFNDKGQKLADGRRARVKSRAAGSGEIIDGLLKGSEGSRAHVISPAASAFLKLGDAESNEAGKGDLVKNPVDLVRSPVVVAFWREQAEALGWPDRPISWADLSKYARDPAAWTKAAGEGAPPFKIAHTHPERSSSGLHTLFALAYAHAGKFGGDLGRTDVAGNAGFAKSLAEFERAVPFYESSTGFLADRMLQGSPADLTAAVVYENLVSAANRASAAQGKPPRIVAIYPAEGTFPTEHPAGVVNRDWVRPEHREAAALYLKFLRSSAEQAEARKLGFRPADRATGESTEPTPLLGVSPAEPKELKAPSASVIQALRTAWEAAKNPDATPPRGK